MTDAAEPSPIKGANFEEEIIRACRKRQVYVTRQPQSGARPDQPGDIVVHVPLVGQLIAEAKKRGKGEGFRQLNKWRDGKDILILGTDGREDDGVYMTLDTFLDLVSALNQSAK